MKKMPIARSRKKFSGEDGESMVRDDMSFGKAFRDARDSGEKEFTWKGKRYNTKLKEEVAPKASMPKTETVTKITEEKRSNANEVPSVAEIEEKTRTTGTGTDTASKLKSGLSDTAEKALMAAGVGATGAALGRQAYKMAKAPLGFTGEAKRMASNVGQSFRNAISGRKPSAAGEGAEAAAEATKSVGPSKMEKARATAQRGSQTKANKRDVKQPKPTEDELDIIRMGSDMKRGGKVGGASRRGDGIAMRGKTRGMMR